MHTKTKFDSSVEKNRKKEKKLYSSCLVMLEPFSKQMSHCWSWHWQSESPTNSQRTTPRSKTCFVFWSYVWCQLLFCAMHEPTSSMQSEQTTYDRSTWRRISRTIIIRPMERRVQVWWLKLRLNCCLFSYFFRQRLFVDSFTESNEHHGPVRCRTVCYYVLGQHQELVRFYVDQRLERHSRSIVERGQLWCRRSAFDVRFQERRLHATVLGSRTECNRRDFATRIGDGEISSRESVIVDEAWTAVSSTRLEQIRYVLGLLFHHERNPKVLSTKGAMLIRPSAPHYLFFGDSSTVNGLQWATSNDLYSWQLQKNLFLEVRNTSYFDSGLVEAGPMPVRLSTGDYLLIYNRFVL